MVQAQGTAGAKAPAGGAWCSLGPLCACMRARVCMCACMYVYMCACVCVCACMCVHVGVCTCVSGFSTDSEGESDRGEIRDGMGWVTQEHSQSFRFYSSDP